MLINRSALLAVTVVLTCAVPAFAQADKKPPAPDKPAASTSTHVLMQADQLKWGPAPPSLPAGAQAAIVDGDPTKAGAFVIRVKFPDGYAVPPHWHPTIENIVVLGGTLMVGMGEKLNKASMHSLTAGGYSKMPARTPHYVIVKGETTIQVHGMGPFQVTYVNPADDPRKKTTTASK
jgi:quercetin dioxygenase-like cupin family protein